MWDGPVGPSPEPTASRTYRVIGQRSPVYVPKAWSRNKKADNHRAAGASRQLTIALSRTRSDARGRWWPGRPARAAALASLEKWSWVTFDIECVNWASEFKLIEFCKRVYFHCFFEFGGFWTRRWKMEPLMCESGVDSTRESYITISEKSTKTGSTGER
jgi:hypothetical protein